MRADLCIEGYPDKNTPTVLVYKDGDIKKQLVTLKELGGVRTSMQDLERLLVDVGAVKLGDARLRRKADASDASTSKNYGRAKLLQTMTIAIGIETSVLPISSTWLQTVHPPLI